MHTNLVCATLIAFFVLVMVSFTVAQEYSARELAQYRKMLPDYTARIKEEHTLYLRGYSTKKKVGTEHYLRGECYSRLGELRLAITDLEKAAKWWNGDALENKDEQGFQNVAGVLAKIAKSNRKLGNLNEAAEIYQQAVDKYQSLNDGKPEEGAKISMAFTIIERAEVLVDLGKDSASSRKELGAAEAILADATKKPEFEHMKKNLLRAQELIQKTTSLNQNSGSHVTKSNSETDHENFSITGSWFVKESQWRGRSLPTSNMIYKFENDRATILASDKRLAGYELVLNRKAVPIQLDLNEKVDGRVKTTIGIIQFLGNDQLIWITNSQSDGNRPKSFSPGNEPYMRRVLVRLPDSTDTIVEKQIKDEAGNGEAGETLAILPKSYQIRFLDHPDGEPTTATDININGTVIGTSGDGKDKKPASWKNGRYSSLDQFKFPAMVYGINDHGMLAGSQMAGNDGVAYLWHDEKLQKMKIDIQHRCLIPYGINDSRQVVGVSFSIMKVRNAWIWEDNKITSLPSFGGYISEAIAINNKGEVVGFANEREYDPCRACLWRNGKAVDLGTLGGPKSEANDISNNSIIVGESQSKTGATLGFVYSSNQMRPLEPLPGETGSFAMSVNDGNLVVGASISGNKQKATLWFNGKAIDLNTIVPGRDGWQLGVARAVNNQGQIAGTAVKHGKTRAFLLIPLK